MPMIMLALAFAQSHAHIAHGAGPVQEPSRPSRGGRIAKQGEYNHNPPWAHPKKTPKNSNKKPKNAPKTPWFTQHPP